MSRMIKYDNDVVAYDLKEDGTGFVYYPNGTVAICISQASEYQNSYYAFDKDKSNTLMLGIDEKGIGFCTPSKRKSAESDGNITIFTSKGGIITNASAKIAFDWKWDRESMDAGIEPTETIVTRLNENIVFRFTSRSSMSLEFQCENARQVCDTSIRFKRNSCYLDNARREPGGRLVPQIDVVTLKDRQITFNTAMKAQNNKLHPKSENLSDMVRDIVLKLESSFGDIDAKMKTAPFFDGTWKTQALENTIREIPRIPISGAETGVFSGFGTHIYVNKEDSLGKTMPSYLLNSTGKVKNDLEIRNTLMKINPPLKRSSMLRAASGRYSSMLVVNKDLVSACNPTGMIVPCGIPLEKVRWNSLKEELASQAGIKGPLTVALVMRAGDPVSCAYQRITELVNRDIVQGLGALASGPDGMAKLKEIVPEIEPVSPQASGFKLIRLEISEEGDVMNDLGLKAVPSFVMFSHGNIAYAGPLGGRPVKTKSDSCKPQVLIIEPNAADQIKAEKTLRKLGCDTFLCLTAAEAIDRIQRMCLTQGGDCPPLVFDLVLISEDIQTNDVMALSNKLDDFTKIKRTIISVMVSVLGSRGYEQLHAVKWEHSAIDQNLTAVVAAPLSNITNWGIQKPIKANSIEHLLSRRVISLQDECFGLTPISLYQKMISVQNELASNGPRRTQPLIFSSNTKLSNTGTLSQTGPVVGAPYIGICLSAEDIRMKGKQLVNPSGKNFCNNKDL